MYYTNEMIKNLGYESVEKFVSDFTTKYKNCSIAYMHDGVYCDYDFDTASGKLYNVYEFTYKTSKNEINDDEVKNILDNLSNIEEPLMNSHRIIRSMIFEEMVEKNVYKKYKQKLFNTNRLDKNKRSIASYYCSIPVKMEVYI